MKMLLIFVFVFIIVPGPPVNLSSNRTDFSEVTLSWSPPLSMPTPNGYLVVYEVADGDDRMTMFADGSRDTVQLNVSIDQNYTAFVVSLVEGSSLPSEASEPILISQGIIQKHINFKSNNLCYYPLYSFFRFCVYEVCTIFSIVISFDISGPLTTLSVSDNATLECEVESLENGIEILSLEWSDLNNSVIAEGGVNSFIVNYINTDRISASLDLELRDVSLSQAGQYKCSVILRAGKEERNFVNTHDIIIQGILPVIMFLIYKQC